MTTKQKATIENAIIQPLPIPPSSLFEGGAEVFYISNVMVATEL